MDIKALNTTFLDIDSIECNEGQIEGVPSNPRTISEERMEALKKSVEELPDMLSMRELLVYPNGGGRFVAIGGNQRLLVCRELGYTQMPVKIIPQETSAKTLMRIAMLDNEEFGKTDWEAIRENWDCEELKDWGIEIEAWDDEEVKREEKRKATEMLSELKFEDIYYTPKVKPSMKLEDCVDLSKFEAKIKALDECKLLNKAMVTPIQFPSAIHAERQEKNGGRLHHRIKSRYLYPKIMKGKRSNIEWDAYPEDVPFTNEPNNRKRL